MINAERVVLLRQARSALRRLRDELVLAEAGCPHCAGRLLLDQGATELGHDLDVVIARLDDWGMRLTLVPPTSERISY